MAVIFSTTYFIPPQNPLYAENLSVKVLVLNYDPIIEYEGGKRLHEVCGWTSPYDKTATYIQDLETSSGGKVDYEIIQWIDVDSFIPCVDYQYTDESFIGGLVCFRCS